MDMIGQRHIEIAALLILAACASGCRERADERTPTAMPAPSAPTVQIQWQDWSHEVFEQAQEADRLILLDIGATWCH